MSDIQFTEPKLAALYDLGNGRGVDTDFYESLTGEPPQDILDLGCGTGLLCHLYAQRGHRVTGIDPAKPMLDVAKAKPNGNAINWECATAEAFSCKRAFDLIVMTGHAFQCLLSDRQISSALETMSTHLKPGGRVVFESRNPVIDWDNEWAREVRLETREGVVMCRRRMIKCSRAECLSFAWDYSIEADIITSESTLRFASHAKIIELAERKGLRPTKLSGDWFGGPFDPNTSKEMIFTFERATRA